MTNFIVVIMALFNDQQQQQEQHNQLQPYGVSFGTRAKARSVQHVPYVPVNMNIGQRLFRARQLHAHPVREQHDVMLQDRVNQDMLQHNIQQQDYLACNRRPFQDQQVMTKSARGGCTYCEPTKRTSK